MPTEIFHFVKSYVLSIATRFMHVFPSRGRDKRSSQEKSARFEESSNGRKPEPSVVGSPAERRSERLPDRNSDEAVSPQTPKETKSGIESSPSHPNQSQKAGSEALQPSNGTGDDQDGDRKAHEESANAPKESATKDSISPDNVSTPGIVSEERDQTSIHRNDRESGSKIKAASFESDSSQIDPIELAPSLPDDANEIEVNQIGAQTATPIEAKTRDPKPKIPPKIGARRSKSSAIVTLDQSQEAIARLELQCRKTCDDDAWEIVISAVEDSQVKSILQDGKQLHLVSGTCSLQSFRGELSIDLQNGAQNSITLFDGSPLVFKLRKDWFGIGRLVKGITKGHYIVFVPSGWNRTGHVPIEPDTCTDEEFTAHYFHADGTLEGEDSEGFQEFDGQLRVVALGLMGKRIFDDSENGDLFVGEVPRLPKSKNYAWARVGEESLDGWRGDNFKPSESDLASVLSGRQGHFFVRIYSVEPVQMLDSAQFRYLRDLKEILLNGEAYSDSALLIPPPGGHDTTEVRFVGIDGSQTLLSLNSPMPHVKQKGSSLYVGPHPEGDCVSCLLDSCAGKVGIELQLPRVWWCLERCSEEQPEWRDTPFDMVRSEFIELAHAGWSIRMLLPSRIKSARFGFNDQRKLEHQLRSNRDALMLDEFVDNECIAEIQYADTSFEAEVDGIPITLIRIAAAPVPKIVSFSRRPKSIDKGRCATLNWETRNAESGGVFIEPEIGAVGPEGTLDVRPEKTTKFTLRLAARGIDDVTKSATVAVLLPPRTLEAPSATVKSGRGGCRKGKGFSPGELQEAGLTSETASSRTLRVDARRRTTHISNVESLRSLTNA